MANWTAASKDLTMVANWVVPKALHLVARKVVIKVGHLAAWRDDSKARMKAA